MSISPAPMFVSLFALVPLFTMIMGIVLAVALVVWIFQIRKSTRETAEETKKVTRMLNDIHNLLREQYKDKE